jgi:hypothetical protein
MRGFGLCSLILTRTIEMYYILKKHVIRFLTILILTLTGRKSPLTRQQYFVAAVARRVGGDN